MKYLELIPKIDRIIAPHHFTKITQQEHQNLIK
jgi:hypothetical protein